MNKIIQFGIKIAALACCTVMLSACSETLMIVGFIVAAPFEAITRHHVDPEDIVQQDRNTRYTGARYPEHLVERYIPHSPDNLLTPLREPPTLTITNKYPVLDGATAFIPIFASAAQALYNPDAPPSSTILRFGPTPAAYEQLMFHQYPNDIIFALSPSSRQRQQADQRGFTHTLTPIAKEAFVFMVNDQNPIQNLSTQQIRDIYSGKIRNWQEVGGADEKILPFQRPDDSGSQTAMQEIMGRTSMRKPLQYVLGYAMGVMSTPLYEIADYQNTGNAIGYSFHFYATKMNPAPGVRLLSIDGVAPSTENIANGTYPFLVDVFMVTLRPLSGNVQMLHDWFLSPQGQQLIEDVGYVPISKFLPPTSAGTRPAPPSPSP
jgi:phosphate transport system substrate-binding protein